MLPFLINPESYSLDFLMVIYFTARKYLLTLAVNHQTSPVERAGESRLWEFE
jgi:hypothetical protein